MTPISALLGKGDGKHMVSIFSGAEFGGGGVVERIIYRANVYMISGSD